MKRTIKTLLKKIIIVLGGCHILRTLNKTPRILYWHGVDKVTTPEIETEITDTSVFIKQIKYLKKFYEIISLEEFENRYKRQTFNGKEIVLTFDDGYANNLYVVADILQRERVPFTVFVSTEHIDTKCYFPTSVNRILTGDESVKQLSIPSQNITFYLTDKDKRRNACKTISEILKSSPLNEVKTITQELINNVPKDIWEDLMEKYKIVRPMTWDEVKLLSDKGATIGSHCKWHTCCHSNQDINEIKSQIIESKQNIEDKITKECRYFAYPNGDFTTESNKIVAATYSMGFSIKRDERIDYKNNIAIIPRIGLPNDYNTFQFIISLKPKNKL